MFVHKQRPSILSSEADAFDSQSPPTAWDAKAAALEARPARTVHPTVGTVKYSGFLNAVGILLVLTNLRLIIENIQKYGVIIQRSLPSRLDLSGTPSFAALAALPLFLLLSLGLEKLAFVLASRDVRRANERSPGMWLVWMGQVCLVVGLLAFPLVVIEVFRPNPGANVILMLFVVTWAMKTYSYFDVNRHLRVEWVQAARGKKEPGPAPKQDGGKQGQGNGGQKASGKKGDDGATPHEKEAAAVTVQYPNNLTLHDVWMFALFPTMCYQPNFPRSPRVRKHKVLKLLAAFVLGSTLIFCITTQYIVPILTNSLLPWQESDVVVVIERALKLAVPNLYVWLIGFYVLFHVYLNLLAELTRFGDRLFYLEWWNSTTIGNFWKTWNLPVHHWMKTHLFLPMIARKYSKPTVLVTAFFLSAVLHEFIISAAFYTVGWYAFAGMMLQIPAVVVTDRLFKNHRQTGNIFFWLTILVGQPFITLFYYVDWHSRNRAA